MTSPALPTAYDRRRVLTFAGVGTALSIGYLLLFAGQIAPGYVRISLRVWPGETDLATQACTARPDCAPHLGAYLAGQLHDLDTYATVVTLTNAVLAALQVAVLIAAAVALLPTRPHRRAVTAARSIATINPVAAGAGLVAQLATIGYLSLSTDRIPYAAQLISYRNAFSDGLLDAGALFYFACFVTANAVTAIVWWVTTRALPPEAPSGPEPSGTRHVES